ncbi:MAG: 2-amino-4-hydroxy-6-hydroxymethyldihydropteridine diphosphokinase [Anaerolineae bacterium]|nr:2-amino-4-hydroxy-6-hydroxymethyldihydropteridine diphosphokinase [Anaerolineae bacterium]
MSKTYLALGTNLGDRLANLKGAIAALPPTVRVIRESSVYETEPWGFENQPNFLNQVIEAETTLPPTDLLHHLKSLENQLGRKPSFQFGPRLIDLDILFYDDLVLDTLALSIPHPRLHERAFVLIPLADIAPDFIHPVYQKTIRELLENLGKVPAAQTLE